MRGFLISIFAGYCVLIGCGPDLKTPNPTSSEPNTIIGDNNLVKIGNSDAAYVKSIGVMHLGCTVTHIGNGISITAGHCIFNTYKTSNHPCGIDTDVTWGRTYDNETGYLTSKCTQIIDIESSNNHDYAILKYSPVPEKKLKYKSTLPQEGATIAIMSYPNMRTLEWSDWCQISGYNSYQINYDCDTEKGSSGAAVLNGNLEIIGIHNFDQDHFNSGTPLANIPLFSR